MEHFSYTTSLAYDLISLLNKPFFGETGDTVRWFIKEVDNLEEEERKAILDIINVIEEYWYIQTKSNNQA